MAGFLYQILAGTAEFLKFEEPKSGVSAVLRFEPEAFNQDWAAVVLDGEGETKRVLIQCKFSSTPSSHPIKPAEFTEIAQTLLASEAEANKVDVLSTKLILCTNRDLSKTQKSKSTGRIDHRLISETLTELQLDEIASRFGIVGAEELERARNRLPGEILKMIGANFPKSLSRHQVQDCLAGFPGAKSLRVSDRADICRTNLEQTIQRRHHGTNLSGMVERQGLLDRALSVENSALIAVTGDGGCGKSILLAQALGSVLEGNEIKIAHYAPSDSQITFGDLVEMWRGSPNRPAADDVGVSRLLAANEGAKMPIAILGLDGVDQIWDSNPPSPWRLIPFFWDLHIQCTQSGKPPVARLYVSCRELDDLKLHIPSDSGFAHQIEYPTISVGPFSIAELEGVISRAHLDEQVKRRLVQACRYALQTDTTTANNPDDFSTLAHVAAQSSRAELDAIKLLLHPATWRCFTSLDRLDQMAIAEGSHQGLDKLAEAFLNWLVERAGSRRGVREQDCRRHLSEMARSAKTFDAIVHPQSFHAFLRECASGGLIEFVPASPGSRWSPQGRWRWKRQFVWEFLSREVGTNGE